jgi:lipopolysaccharide export system permease protein
LIINRAFIREVAQTSAGVTVVIVSIFVVIRLVRFLSKAASGDIPVDAIFTLLFLKVVAYVDLILPLMLFAAILMVMNRWVRDNELTVLYACGVGLRRLLRPTLWLAGGLTLIVAAFSFVLTPMSVEYETRIMEESKQRTEISGVVPGVFADRPGAGVYYVEKLGKEDEASLINIFVYGKTPKAEDVVIAKDGYQYVDEKTGDRFLVLRHGHRYEGTPGRGDYTVLEFETYALRIKTRVELKPVGSVKALPTTALIGVDRPEAVAELQWRLSKPISVPILAVLALSFTYVSVRRTQFLHMVAGFGVYFLYSNVLGYANALLKKGKLAPELGLWWVHAIFAVLAIILFMRRAQNRPFSLPFKLRWPSRS